MPAEGDVDEPDPKVVEAARRGDTGAFEVLVRRYQAEVWRLSFHLVHDQASADDVTQDAFVRVYRFLPRYRGDSKFSTWLFSIARNCAYDELRRRGRRRATSLRLESERARDASEHTAGIEVREALARLPLELREPIVLIDMFGASYREVASILDVPEGTVKSRVHRARDLLVQALGLRGRRSSGEV